MARTALHRFERDGRRFVLDTDTCFCFECDAISWDVLGYYPDTPVNQIVHTLGTTHPPAELEEVIGELEWLRATKSILPLKKQQDQIKDFELVPGLRQLDLSLDGRNRLTERCDGALMLLLGRSGTQKNLKISLFFSDFEGLGEWLPQWGKRAFDCAKMAGKVLTLGLVHTAPRRHRADKALGDHPVNVACTFTTADTLAPTLGAWSKARSGALGRLTRSIGTGEGEELSVTLVPHNGTFDAAVRYLVKEGFKRVDIDIIAAYGHVAAGESDSIVSGLESTAVFYAQELLKRNYFRLEPIAGLFHQIYEGKARSRADEAGTWLLAMDERGDIYPSRHFFDVAEYRLGNICDGDFDEDRRSTFDDMGIMTTSPCGTCWARNLCGGGYSAVHRVLGGSIRRPDGTWCDSQRDWYAAAIAAFNMLSAEGVDFARLYQNLRPGKGMSLWGMARAALTMNVGLRPIEESDAALLTRWENWSEAAYFLGNEYGVFLATRYDREMDSLHPRGIEQEFMIISRRGAPLGLLKIRPDGVAGLARVWIYFQDQALYQDKATRSSFSRIIREASKQGAFRRFVAASGPGDNGLSEFLEAIGFAPLGVEREALFLHDAYHDIALFQMVMSPS